MRQKIISNYLFIFLLIVGFSTVNKVNSQKNHSLRMKRAINFPDISGYKTLLCDFHQHTVFSDGEVWPSIRVKEALKDELDAISITEHLEYQPHREDIPHKDRNRSYQIALKEVGDNNLIVINGAEITREMPPGHLNAIFLNDANKLLKDDVIEVCREAKKQGAFIFWNHPNWIAQAKSGVAKLNDLHHQLLEEGLIDGIEVVNEFSYSEKALEIAINYNLTLMGNSDIHGLIDWDYKILDRGHRPVTLVFAKEKSKKAIKEALNNQRTAVWFKNTLIGNSKYLTPLIQKSLKLKKVEVLESYEGKSFVKSVHIENISEMDYILENKSDFAFYSHANVITVKANKKTIIQVKTLDAQSTFDLRFKVLNAIVAPNKHPEIILNI